MKKTIEIIKAISDENRLRIVMMLKRRKMCVCEILYVLSVANSTLSAHLKILRFAGLIDVRKDGRWMEYFLSCEDQYLSLLDCVENSIQDKRVINSDREMIKTITRDECSAKIKEKNKCCEEA